MMTVQHLAPKIHQQVSFKRTNIQSDFNFGLVTAQKKTNKLISRPRLSLPLCLYLKRQRIMTAQLKRKKRKEKKKEKRVLFSVSEFPGRDRLCLFFRNVMLDVL